VIRTAVFAREQLRAPFTLALLIAVPILFVIAAAGALSDFADALGGELADDAAVALGAGWAAAFLSGALGFFSAVSAHDADRRLSLAGLGPARVAASRIASALVLALTSAAAAFIALEVRAPVAHPSHAAAAIFAFALLYVAVGVVVGSLIRAPLEGSLVVVFIFLLDAFTGPGMSGSVPTWAISQKPAAMLIAAGMGHASPAGDWLRVGLVLLTALLAALAAFVISARRRG
jgi:hypothetical protein